MDAVPKRVLLVEANPGLREYLQRRLRSEGYIVKAAGWDVENSFEEHVDVALLGLGELGEEGLAMMDRIHTVSPRTPIIAMAPEAHFKLSLAARKHGAYDDIQVPFDLQELLDKLNAACAARQAS
ncbi:response regulator [Megalodesulfovibrio paquesii]